MPSGRTWFITGTSRGFGREWAAAALARGDRVVGTARDPTTLDDLVAGHPSAFVALPLDVTNRDQVFKVVRQAHDHFGELDIIVNNAGYGHFGMIEEVTEDEARSQMETNLFGALWVTQAALPYLRQRRHGHLLQISSISGITAVANLGLYNSSKWALEGFSEALSREVEQFGIRVTLIEPGPFATDWAGSSARRSQPNPAYEELRERRRKSGGRLARGQAESSAEALLAVVDAEQPPLRVFFGAGLLDMAQDAYQSRLNTWREWQPITEIAQR